MHATLISEDNMYQFYKSNGRKRLADSRAATLAHRSVRRDIIQSKWFMREARRDEAKTSNLTERIKCAIRYEMAFGEYQAALDHCPSFAVVPWKSILRKQCRDFYIVKAVAA